VERQQFVRRFEAFQFSTRAIQAVMFG
jgi:hypothetical protein